jgi:glycine dehydrogenase
MLSFLGYKSMEEFVSQTVPGNIRIKELDDKDIRPLSELEFMRRAERLAAENKMVKSYIGMGYHNAIVPPVIQRNVSRVSRGRDLDRSRWTSQLISLAVHFW